MVLRCDKQSNQLDGDQQDATGFALRLHGAQFTWKFRCNNNQLCQKINPDATGFEFALLRIGGFAAADQPGICAIA